MSAPDGVSAEVEVEGSRSSVAASILAFMVVNWIGLLDSLKAGRR